MVLSGEAPDSQTRLWCAGLPLESTRDLTDLERRYLRKAALHELSLFALLSLSAAAWTAAILKLGPAVDRADHLGEGLGIIVFFGWILLFAVQVASANDAFRHW